MKVGSGTNVSLTVKDCIAYELLSATWISRGAVWILKSLSTRRSKIHQGSHLCVNRLYRGGPRIRVAVMLSLFDLDLTDYRATLNDMRDCRPRWRLKELHYAVKYLSQAL
jgi:hypothetical protein